MNNQEMSETFDRAADYIDTHGWLQGSYCNEEGNVCAEGAIRKVILGDGDETWRIKYTDAAKSLQIYLVKYQELDTNVPQFNDNPDRTQGEVTDFLRSAAKELRG